MIKAILIISTSGRQLLVKFYEDLAVNIRDRIVSQVYKECSKRGDMSTCFIENLRVWEEYLIVYRYHNSLYTVFVVDEAENELATLDLIGVFIEVLTKMLGAFREDQIHSHQEKAYALLEEIVIGGMVFETNAVEVWRLAESILKHEKT